METLTYIQEFGQLASDEQVEKTVRALEANGIHTVVFDTGREAREYLMNLIPSGVKVYNSPSRTMDLIGVTEEIENATRFQPVRTMLKSLDRATQRGEIRRLVSSPDVVVGSVHAITVKGEVLIASATGSQLSAVSAGAGAVIWVAGTQKLVSTLDEGFRRIREYCYPLEDNRTRQFYGTPSAINKVLVVNGEQPGRMTMILVKQDLGF